MAGTIIIRDSEVDGVMWEGVRGDVGGGEG